MAVKSILINGIFLLASIHSFSQDASDVARFQSYFSQKEGNVSLEQVLHQSQMKLEQAREIRDPKETSKALTNLGLIYLNRVHDYEKAMDLFIEALSIQDSLKLESQQVLTYVAVARVFEIAGDFHESAQFLELALSLNKDGKDINAVAMILNNLGRINASRGQIGQAFENYKQVLRYKNDVEKAYEGDAHSNLAHLHTSQGKYEEALTNYKRALAITRETGDRQGEAASLNDIGVLYGLMKNDEKSLANHQVALDIQEELGDKRGIAESHNNLGWLYFRKGNWERAIHHGLLALENGRESQAQEQIFKSYELLSQAHKKIDDYKNALAYKELGLAIHEFIQSEKQERQLLETQNRYVLGKKEKEIERLDALRVEREREIAQQKKFRNILFLVVVLVFVTAGLLLILYLVKRRSNRILRVAKKEVQQQNQKLQELNQTKDKFFSIISHDLKGPLNSLTSFSRLLIDHTDAMSKEEIQLLAKDLDKSVKNLLTLLENLLDWARSQTGNIDFSPEEFELGEVFEGNKTLLESQAATKRIAIRIENPGPMRVTLHKQSINTVVRNLISNAIKFTPEGGVVRAGFRVEESRLNIFVTDNGVGMTREVMERIFRLDSKHSTNGTANEKGTGLGLILCREFVEKNGGRISVESTAGKGTSFTASFPLSIRSKTVPRREVVSF